MIEHRSRHWRADESARADHSAAVMLVDLAERELREALQ